MYEKVTKKPPPDPGRGDGSDGGYHRGMTTGDGENHHVVMVKERQP